MIHLIYIYFIINAFIAGFAHSDLDNWRYTLCCLFLGCLFPLHLLYSWLDKHLEISMLFVLYFTNWFQYKITPEMITVLQKTYGREKRPYKRWILRRIDAKFKLGITK